MSIFFEQVLFQGPGIDADTDRHGILACFFNDLSDFGFITDIAGIDPKAVYAGIEGHQSKAMTEVNVGDKGNPYAALNFIKFAGSLLVGHGHADELTSCVLKSMNLINRGRNIPGIGIGHRLDRHRRIAADGDRADMDLLGEFSFHQVAIIHDRGI